MKKRIQKLTSLALVLVMLVTMIPVGGFIVTAEVSEALAAGLAAYDTTTEFVINNVDDWNAIAETDKNFSGKTVKLGADIDAGGATLPVLFKAQNASATFDGAGHAIKNVGTKETPNPVGLLSAKSNLKVQNLTLENVYVSGEGNKGILVDWQNCWGKYTFKNIKVLNSSVTSTTGAAAALIAYMSGNGGGTGVDFENILVDGVSITASNKAAALIGNIYTNNGDYGVSAKNIEVLNTTVTDNTAAACAAGLFGYFRMHVNVALTVENAYVNATFLCPLSSGWTGVNTALFQTANSSVANNNRITVKNCMTNCTYATGVVQSTTMFYATQGIFTTSNLYAVQDRNMEGMCVNGGNTVNGTPGLQSGYERVPAEIIAAAAIPFMLQYDANGFISKVWGLAEDDTVFPDYDTTTEFVVNNIEDWKKIASSHKTFNGKTIKLGADIDAEGAPLSFLVFTLSPTSVTFDGQGHTVKNVGTEDAPIMNSLIAYSLGGATVKNVTFENIYMTSKTEAALIAIALESQDGMTTTVERVKVKNSHVLSETSNAGALVAKVTDKGTNGAINFRQIQIDDQTTVKGNSATGGIIGTANHQKPLNLIGIETSATVTGTSTKVPTDKDPNYDQSVGGLIGYAYVNGTELNVKSCAINGTVQATKIDAKGQEVKSSVVSIAGTIGFVEGPFPGVNTDENEEFTSFASPVRTLNLESVIINCNFSTDARHRSLVVNLKAIGFFNYKNVYTTKPVPMWQFVAINYWNIINGKQEYGETSMANEHGRDDFLTIVPYIANRMKTKDADGFLLKISSIVEPHVAQNSAVKDGKYSVRFIGTAQVIDVQTVEVHVKATTASGAVRTFVIQSPLFDQITPFEAHDINETIVAADIGAEKLVCLTVYDIPVGEAVDFELTVKLVTRQGKFIESTETMEFSFDANGALLP